MGSNDLLCITNICQKKSEINVPKLPVLASIADFLH